MTKAKVADAIAIPVVNTTVVIAPVATMAWSEKFRPGTIGRTIAEAIEAGELDNNQILSLIKETNPTAKTTYACIAWYKSKAHKAGIVTKKPVQSKPIVVAPVLEPVVEVKVEVKKPAKKKGGRK